MYFDKKEKNMHHLSMKALKLMGVKQDFIIFLL